ncbi:MAG: hypothetical protein ACXVZP_02700 [Gaiellaceae bacterium]
MKPLLLMALLALLSVGGSTNGSSAGMRTAALGKPLVWFAPLPAVAPRPQPEGIGYGSSDYMKLFSPTASWTRAAGHVNVFKLYGNWVEQAATPDELATIVGDLKRRGIALAVELQPLQPSADCGQGVEGFDSLAGATAIAERIRAAGGTIAYAALDEPFFYGSLYDGPGACHWSEETIAQQIVAYVSALRSVFPDVVVGDIEPMPSGVTPDEIAQWLDVYRAVSGAPFPFFHLDVTFTTFLRSQTWAADAGRLEQASHRRGIPFGMIYDGNGDSDLGWTQSAEQRIETYELVARGRPDQVIFQSWVDHPDRVLPEGSSGSFTNLIDRYFRPRPALRLQLRGTRVSGTLRDAGGRPVSPQRLEVLATPLEGPGSRGTYSIAGIVPAGATRASVGFRVNSECGCSGPSDLSLFSSGYSEGGGANLVQNPSFADGLAGWTTSGDVVAAVGSDKTVQVQAAPSQASDLTSADFPVSAGGRFVLTFVARVAPVSSGSGYFGVFFRDNAGDEVSRAIIPLAPASVTLAGPRTTGTGSFHATLRGLPTEPARVAVWFRGSNRLFPAYASAPTP